MARASTRQAPPLRELGKDGLCEQIAAYLELAWPRHLPWTHFPAGEERPSIERIGRDGRPYRFSPAGARLKRMGLKPGWFDFQFILPNGQFASAEVKVSGNWLDDDQDKHWKRLGELKCGRAVWQSVEEAEATITRWLAAFGLTPLASVVQWRGRR